VARIAVQKPETVRVALSEGDWIEVKKFLNVGEQRSLEGAGIAGVRGVGREADSRSYELNYERLTLSRIEAYVLDWSFLGLDGKALKVTPENIRTLIPAIAKEIDEALDAHIKAMEAELKRPPSSPAGETTSPSAGS
jgi:hypothetical protein